MIESVLNKVTAFSLNPQLRRILGARNNLLDFQEIMDEGRVLLVDLGRCDMETRRLLGSLIVTGLEQAARSRKETTRRTPFYFCIDEFQDFCANEGAVQTLAQILSESRKFGLHLTLAHQTLSQVDTRLLGALGNIQLKIVFGVSRQDAEILAFHLFQVNSLRIKHMVSDAAQQDRSHPLYYTLQEEWEKNVQALQNLKPRSAYLTHANQRGATEFRTVTVMHQDVKSQELEKAKSLLLRNVSSWSSATGADSHPFDHDSPDDGVRGKEHSDPAIREKSMACMQTKATSELRRSATWQNGSLTVFRSASPNDGIA